jgi:hypothetical protein
MQPKISASLERYQRHLDRLGLRLIRSTILFGVLTLCPAVTVVVLCFLYLGPHVSTVRESLELCLVIAFIGVCGAVFLHTSRTVEQTYRTRFLEARAEACHRWTEVQKILDEEAPRVLSKLRSFPPHRRAFLDHQFSYILVYKIATIWDAPWPWEEKKK